MTWGGVVVVCWFVVPMCIGFRVGTFRGPPVQRVIGEDLYPSPRG